MTIENTTSNNRNSSAWLAVALRVPAPVLAAQFRRAIENSKNTAANQSRDSAAPGPTSMTTRSPKSPLIVSRLQPAKSHAPSGPIYTSSALTKLGLGAGLANKLPAANGRTLTLSRLDGGPAAQALQALFQRCAQLARAMAVRNGKVEIEPASLPGTRITIQSVADGWVIEVRSSDAAIARAIRGGQDTLAALFADAGLGRVNLTVAELGARGE